MLVNIDSPILSTGTRSGKSESSTALEVSLLGKAKTFTQSTIVELLKRIDHGLLVTRIDLYGFLTEFPGVLFSSKLYQYNELVNLFTRRGLTRDNIVTLASHVVKGGDQNANNVETESVLRSYYSTR